MKNYDLIIIGSGPAGVMAAKAASRKGMKVLIIEKGKNLIQRKDLISGWFGHGLFLMDRLELVDSTLDNPKMIKEAFRIVQRHLEDKPQIFGKGESKHCFLPTGFGDKLAKYFFEKLTNAVDIVFGVEIDSIESSSSGFVVSSVRRKFKAKRCIIATGRNSFEWIEKMCCSLNLPMTKSSVKIGIRAELPLFRTGNFSETIDQQICYDIHVNSFVGEWEESGLLSTSAYSLPEKNSGKISFMIGAKIDMTDAIRSVKIVNVLTNDKIKTERVNEYMEGKSVLQHIACFAMLNEAFQAVSKMIPSFVNYAIVHIPEIKPAGMLQVDNDMKTIIPNLYGIGDCTSKVSNTLGAMASGLIAAKTTLRE